MCLQAAFRTRFQLARQRRVRGLEPTWLAVCPRVRGVMGRLAAGRMEGGGMGVYGGEGGNLAVWLVGIHALTAVHDATKGSFAQQVELKHPAALLAGGAGTVARVGIKSRLPPAPAERGWGMLRLQYCSTIARSPCYTRFPTQTFNRRTPARRKGMDGTSAPPWFNTVQTINRRPGDYSTGHILVQQHCRQSRPLR